MRGVVEFFGILFGVPTIVSLIQHAFNFELASLLLFLLEQYRALLSPVFDVLQAPIAWVLNRFALPMPVWLQDVHTLSFIGASFGYKALQKDPEPRGEGIWTYLSSLVWGAMFLGLVYIGQLLFAMLFGHRTQTTGMRVMFQAGWITAIGVGVFYLANQAMLAGLLPAATAI